MWNDQLLAARRLIEAGVRCVTVAYGFWDTHGNNFNRLKNDLCPPADRALTALLEDLSRTGRLVNKEQIVEHLCEWGEEISANAVEVYMHRLRKKLEGAEVRIATVRGLGYCLEKPIENLRANEQ